MGSGNSKDSTSSSSTPQIPVGVTANRVDAATTCGDAISSIPEPAQSVAAVAVETESKCPMHNTDGSYNWNLTQAFSSGSLFPHWFGGSKPISEQQARAMSVPTTAAGATSIKIVEDSTNQQSQPQPGQESGCPVKHGQRVSYNVYGQPINPSNQMALNPNQLPAPTQSIPLPVERVSSSIPKGGTEDKITWTYPSPQMFYNALARKGKISLSEDQNLEHDMVSVVALHNHMNETTWRKILQWEQEAQLWKRNTKEENHPQQQNRNSDIKLLKFQGRPTDLSPKAALKHYLFGHPLPYDRHDWIIERPDRTTVRYVIDYYHDETQARDDTASAVPDMRDPNAVKSLLVDVRPAVDSPEAVWQRLVLYGKYQLQQTTYEPLPLWPSMTMKSQVKESIDVWNNIRKSKQQQLEQQQQQQPPIHNIDNIPTISEAEAKEMTNVFQNCQSYQEKLGLCTTEVDITKASLDWTMCIGKRLCRVQHEAMVQQLHQSNNDDTTSTTTTEQLLDDALERLHECVAYHHQKNIIMKQQQQQQQKQQSN